MADVSASLRGMRRLSCIRSDFSAPSPHPGQGFYSWLYGAYRPRFEASARAALGASQPLTLGSRALPVAHWYDGSLPGPRCP
jgi:hypothetical protein